MARGRIPDDEGKRAARITMIVLAAFFVLIVVPWALFVLAYYQIDIF